jgi:S-adenosylmethionine:tRNA ribosyltransferase-isomerase
MSATTAVPGAVSFGAGREWLGFTLDATHEAHEPPEARGLRRDQGRLLVSDGHDDPIDTRFDRLGRSLRPGDLIVVNTSATIAAALDGFLPGGEPVVVHLSTLLPAGLWMVEVRQPDGGTTRPRRLERPQPVDLVGGGQIRLLTPFGTSARLWIAALDPGVDGLALAAERGRPVRYRHVPDPWPLSAYQTIFATEPGSAEMPSASRPFSHELVTDLVSSGVAVVPLVLHTGVSSLEGGEAPYPERYRVSPSTAAAVNACRQEGGRVIAAGTTVVRALATVTDDHGGVHAGEGWTDVVVTAETPVPAIDGLLTGWHEPESTHLLMLEAFADHDVLRRAYRAALDLHYLWHEFGDSHLILRPGR